jgi:hypothetical protein
MGRNDKSRKFPRSLPALAHEQLLDLDRTAKVDQVTHSDKAINSQSKSTKSC